MACSRQRTSTHKASENAPPVDEPRVGGLDHQQSLQAKISHFSWQENNSFLIKCNFGLVRELCVNIRLFRSLIPHLPSNHVEQVKLRGDFITDDEFVNDINETMTLRL